VVMRRGFLHVRPSKRLPIMLRISKASLWRYWLHG